MEFLKLAIKAGLPLIHIRTDDIINVEDVLTHISGEPVKPLAVPEHIAKVTELKVPEGRVFYTSVECKSLVKLYHFCVDNGKTVIFVNTEKSVVQFDGQTLIPPKELVLKLLGNVTDEAEALLPSFAGLTLKDVGEMAQLTMTRDESISSRGVNETRRGYSNLKGIQQVDTGNIGYYMCPSYLEEWMKLNTKFYKQGNHKALVPRGLLFDGPPGTGKTLAAKYIASEFGVPLYRLDLGSMMGKFVGDSENALNAALSQIAQVSPACVILDEVEKVFQAQGDSGVTSRLLSQLLWFLQENDKKTFVVMTTNDVSKIPEELYREGRIDAVMDFMGIESKEDGIVFAHNVLKAVAPEIPIEVTQEDLDTLSKRVKMCFHDDMAVPQAKLTQEVYTLIRELSAE